MRKILCYFFTSICMSVLCSSFAYAQANQAVIQQVLKSTTNTDFKIISNDEAPLKDISFVVVEDQNGNRLALLASKDGSYMIPITDGIATSPTPNSLKLALDNVNSYNKNKKDKKVLALFQKYQSSILNIPALTKQAQTTYMILDTTCPYCLQEILRLDEYLKRGNIQVLIVGILGQKAHDRAAGYYSELPQAQTREQKIALLKKVFEVSYAPKAKNEKLAKQMAEATLEAGVQGVPYLILK